MSSTVSSHLVEVLEKHKINHVFELIGGMITIMVDELHRSDSIQVHSMHHEQGAAFAAEGLARVDGKFGVALATSGPGATNLITGIGSSFFDSVPMLFLTGQVNSNEISNNPELRQSGFQEMDIVSMVKPITKYAVRLSDPNEFPAILEHAIEIATTGRKGPVLIDIPMDYQRAEIRQKISTEKSSSKSVEASIFDQFNDDLSSALANSMRPLIIAGGGIASSTQTAQFREFVLSKNIPVVRTLMGLDALPTSSNLNIGFLGSYGNRWTNLAIADADLLLVMGSRLDIRQTGSDVHGFLGNRKVFQVDIDAAEIDNRVTTTKSLNYSLADYFKFSQNNHFTFSDEKLNSWLQHIEQIKMKYPHDFENIPQSGINPNSAIEEISKEWQEVGTFVTDVGQHQMWVAQSIQLNEHQRCLTSGGMGAMGFGLPAAIGAAFNDKSAPVCVFAGDGGLQLNIQELETLKRNNLNIRIIVLDNKTHGMVRQFQETYFNGRYGSTLEGYSAPNFAKIAQAYGIESLDISDGEELTQAIDRYRNFKGPLLLSLKIETFLNVYPKLAFGKNFGDMEPQVKSSEMEGT